jgi:hypothetical protein
MRRCALVLIIVLFATACDFSHVKPQQTVTISGRALSATGAPLSNVQVHLYKEADFGEFIVGTVLTIGSLGGVCLFPGAPAICQKGRAATTDAKGGYRFSLKGSDTQGIVGDAAKLDVVFADPKAGATGPSTPLRFEAQQTVVRLPAASLWDARLHVTASAKGAPSVGLSWRPQHGSAGSYAAQLLDTRGAPLWSQSATAGRVRIDARVLEDRAAVATVTTRHDIASGVNAVYLSARKPVRPVAGAPPSRHQPCSALTGTSHVAAFRQTVCVATDGDLTSPSRLVASNGKVVTGVMIQLERARRVSLVVARGLAGSAVVEVSANGRNWHTVATVNQSTAAVRLAGRPETRYVRVRSPGGLDESLIAEVSAW